MRVIKIAKSILFLILAFTLLFAFSSCGKDKLDVKASIKYLTQEEYSSGKIDENLSSSLSVGAGEKGYVVVDFTLTGVSKIDESVSASVNINFSTTSIGTFKLNVEDIPTTDYSVSGGKINSNFKINDSENNEKKLRFIVSVSTREEMNIEVQALISVSDDSIELTGETAWWGKVTFVGETTEESKLSYQLSSDGTYYVVTGIGTETGDKITIPDMYNGKPVKEIDDRVFSDLTYLKEIILPGELKKIGSYAFENCTSLKEIKILLSVIEIGEDAFAGCSELHVCCETAQKPTEWSESAFSGVKVVTYGCSRYFEFSLSNDKTFYTLKSAKGILGNVTIPETYMGLPVSYIGSDAFRDCKEVTSVVIPSSVRSIERYAFKNCSKLSSIVMADSVTSIGNNAFENCDALVNITLGNGIKVLEAACFAECDKLLSIVLPASVVTIYHDVFDNCGSLESIKFRGTESQWNAVEKHDGWNNSSGNFTVTYNYDGE